jgi:hypothetical protein
MPKPINQFLIFITIVIRHAQPSMASKSSSRYKVIFHRDLQNPKKPVNRESVKFVFV